MRIALLLALVLLLTLAGCGSNGDSPGGDQTPGETPATTQKDGGYDYP
jgi:predicted small lipoprotein YifL